MPKKNPWSLKRPAAKPVTRTFTDPQFPGEEWTLTARPLTGCELMLVTERSAAEAAKWLDEDGTQRETYPLGEGKVKLSTALFQTVGMLEAMQQDEAGAPYAPDDFYTQVDLIGLAHQTTSAWGEINTWLGEVLASGKRPASGNSPGADA
jgi:hypothetical protein